MYRLLVHARVEAPSAIYFHIHTHNNDHLYYSYICKTRIHLGNACIKTLQNSPFATIPSCAHTVRRTYLLSFGFVLFQRGIARQSSPPLPSQHTPAASVRKSGREIDDFRPTLFRHTSLDCLLSYIYYIYINIFFCK